MFPKAVFDRRAGFGEVSPDDRLGVEGRTKQPSIFHLLHELLEKEREVELRSVLRLHIFSDDFPVEGANNTSITMVAWHVVQLPPQVDEP